MYLLYGRRGRGNDAAHSHAATFSPPPLWTASSGPTPSDIARNKQRKSTEQSTKG